MTVERRRRDLASVDAELHERRAGGRVGRFDCGDESARSVASEALSFAGPRISSLAVT
jgi:hypothetical protein